MIGYCTNCGQNIDTDYKYGKFPPSAIYFCSLKCELELKLVLAQRLKMEEYRIDVRKQTKEK